MSYDPWKLAEELTDEDLERLKEDAKKSDPSMGIPFHLIPWIEPDTET